MCTSLAVLTCLAASFGAAPDAAQLARVRAELTSDQVEVRRMAIQALIHSDLSVHLFPEMRARLKDDDGKVRSVAATAIGNLGQPAESAIAELIAQLKLDKYPEARETAARALGRIGKAVPTNRTAVKPLTNSAADDADPVTRTVALGALAMMDEDVPGQVAALRKFLHHDVALVRMKASHALGMIGLPAKAAAAEIADALAKETDGHRRGYVARALGNVGDPKMLPVLEKALEAESDDGAKGEMRGAIQKLGGKK